MTATADPPPPAGADVGVPGALRAGRMSGWTFGALGVATLAALPVLAVIAIALFPAENIWPHLAATVLPRYLANTALLMAGNAVGILLIGVGTAWLVSTCQFAGRSVFEWALLLPLAVPSYIIAFVYTDFLEFAGPVQGLLRAAFGWHSAAEYWFPEIRSLGGAIAVMSLVLYPYVYLLARAAFLEQSVCVLEVSRTLGRGPWRTFAAVALPLARPAIVVGLALAMMETLADFGTVDFFAVNTLTVGVFDTWLAMNNAGGAAQIALVMLAVVLVLLAAERWGRRGQRFHHTSTRYRPLTPHRLGGGAALAATLACALPVALGFALPALLLAINAVRRFGQSWSPDFLGFAANSLMLAALAALVTVAVATFLAYAMRLARTPLLAGAARLAATGYAVPGAVLALGVLIPLGAFDNAIDAAMRRTFGVSTGLVLSGTIAALVFAYVVRFLAVALGAVEASLAKVRPSLEMVARTLGHGPGPTLRRVHLPLMRTSLLAAATIVFVDTMKELPATLILRPFNFDTLATHVYQLASDELLEQSALGSLAIVLVGVVPVVLLSRAIARSRPGAAAVDQPLAATSGAGLGPRSEAP